MSPSKGPDGRPHYGCRTADDFAQRLQELEQCRDSALKRFPALDLVDTDRSIVGDDRLWARGQLTVARTGSAGHRVRSIAAENLRDVADSIEVTAAVLQFLSGEQDMDWLMTRELSVDCLARARAGDATYAPLKTLMASTHDNDELRARVTRALASQLPQWSIAVACQAARTVLATYLDQSEDRTAVLDGVLREPRVMANNDVRSIVVSEACDHWRQAQQVIVALGEYPADAERVVLTWIEHGNLGLVRALVQKADEAGVHCLGETGLSTVLQSGDAETRVWAIARTGQVAPTAKGRTR